MNRAKLEKPFDPSQIRQRQGRSGVLDYVEGWSVVQRLNEALDGAWSFEVVHHEVRDDEVLVLGKLSAEGITKMQFGASQVTRERGTGQLVSLGDDLKAAATDALKKCATFLGVGLHLYSDRPFAATTAGGRNGAGRPPARPRSDSATPGEPVKTNGNGHVPAASGDGAGRATERQLEAIIKIGRAKGLEPAAVEGLSVRVFQRKPGQLTRAEASELLRQLSNLKRGAA